MCIVMTRVEEDVVAAGDLNPGTDPQILYVARNKAVIIALSVMYGIGCLVLSGTVMVYGFFLARRVRRNPPGWLFSRLPSKRALRSQLSMGKLSQTMSSAP